LQLGKGNALENSRDAKALLRASAHVTLRAAVRSLRNQHAVRTGLGARVCVRCAVVRMPVIYESSAELIVHAIRGVAGVNANLHRHQNTESDCFRLGDEPQISLAQKRPAQ